MLIFFAAGWFLCFVMNELANLKVKITLLNIEFEKRYFVCFPFSLHVWLFTVIVNQCIWNELIYIKIEHIKTHA